MVAVVADSAANVPESLAQELRIEVQRHRNLAAAALFGLRDNQLFIRGAGGTRGRGQARCGVAPFPASWWCWVLA
jgi:hypothetical protein